MDSISTYMELLANFPVLTKEEEQEIFSLIEDYKKTLLEVCAANNSVRKIMKETFECGNHELSKVFNTSKISHIQAQKEKILKNIDSLETDTLVLDLLKLSVPWDWINAWADHVKTKKCRELRLQIQKHKNKIVECNLKLVFSRAKKHLGKGLALEDLLQEGNIGLLKAVDRFDYTKDYKFSTYATWWIEQTIRRAIANKSRTIRIPVHLVDDINRLSTLTKKLTDELGRVPTEEELSKFSGISIEKINNMKQLNLFSPVFNPHEDNNIEPVDVLENTEDPEQDLDEIFEKTNRYNKLREKLATLPPLWEKFLRLRFGLGEKKIVITEEVLKNVSKRFD